MIVSSDIISLPTGHAVNIILESRLNYNPTIIFKTLFEKEFSDKSIVLQPLRIEGSRLFIGVRVNIYQRQLQSGWWLGYLNFIERTLMISTSGIMGIESRTNVGSQLLHFLKEFARNYNLEFIYKRDM